MTYQHDKEDIHGNITIDKEIVKTTIPKPPTFTKIFTDFPETIENFPPIPTRFFVEVARRMDYVNYWNMRSVVYIGESDRIFIAGKCGVSSKTVERYVSLCVEAGIFFRAQTRGYYIVNPFFIAKGQWRYIAEFREEFDYIDGKWVFVGSGIEYTHDPAFFDTDIPEEQEKKDPYAHSSLYHRVQAVIDAQDQYENGTISKEEENVQTQQE